MGIYLPVPVVAAVVAYFYGRSIHSAWLPAIITFVCVAVGVGAVFTIYHRLFGGAFL